MAVRQDEYVRQKEDQAYRFISLNTSDTPLFKQFSKEESRIPIPSDNKVLEILKQDGSTQLFFCGEKKTIYYMIGEDRLVLNNDCPKQRLWVVDKKGIRYKCPTQWKYWDRSWYCLVKNSSNIVLVGDKYLSCYYCFITN